MKKTLIVLGCMSLGLAHAQQNGRDHAQHQTPDTRVGINTENPVATLELKKVEGLPATQVQGFLLPHLTKEERDAMEKEALVNGLMIFNTTKNCIDWWDGAKWQCMDGTQKDGPSPKLPTTNSITLPNGLSIINGEHMIASILDNNYLPYTLPDTPASWTERSNPNTTGTDKNIDVKGQIPSEGITVKIPVTFTSGSPVLPAYTTYAVTEAEAWKDGQARILELSWAQQTLSSTNKTITATIKVKDATTNQELTQLDLRNGLGNDYKGLLLGQFKMPKNNNEASFANYTGTYNVRVISGVPDKNIAKETIVDGENKGYLHQFIYLPMTGPDGKLWLNNNLGADYANINSPHFDPAKQAENKYDIKAFGSLFQFSRDGDGHELVTWAPGSGGYSFPSSTFIFPTISRTVSNIVAYTVEKDPCPTGWSVPSRSILLGLKPYETAYFDTTIGGLKAPSAGFYMDDVKRNNSGWGWLTNEHNFIGSSKYHWVNRGVGATNSDMYGSYRETYSYSIRCVKL